MANCPADCGFVHLAMDHRTTCAVRADGTVWCWGINLSGEVGNGTTGFAYSPTQTLGIGNAVKVENGGYHACALLDDGTVWCWGDNGSGQLGDGTDTERLTPVQVQGLTDAVDIGANAENTCALRSNGSLWCWGNEAYHLGPLEGPATDTCYPYPSSTGDACAKTPVLGSMDSDFVGLWSGQMGACGWHTDGHVTCWGMHYIHASQFPSYLPAQEYVPTVPYVQAATNGSHTCLLHPGGSLDCFGYNIDGALGFATTGDGTDVPTPVPGLPPVTQVSAGGSVYAYGFTCAVVDDGRVFCWGCNDDGQLGDGTTVSRATPAPVWGLSGMVEVATSYQTACARNGAGETWCWGYGQAGRLGHGSTSSANALIPVAVDMP